MLERSTCHYLPLVLLLALLWAGWPMLQSAWTGVFQTESSDLDGEVEVFATRLGLRPGMTLCEMGSANGALISRLGRKVII